MWSKNDDSNGMGKTEIPPISIAPGRHKREEMHDAHHLSTGGNPPRTDPIEDTANKYGKKEEKST